MFAGSSRVLSMALVLSSIVGVAAADSQIRQGESEVSLSIASANQEPVLIVVREGELATYTSFSQEESFSLVPRVDESTGEVTVQVVGVTGEPPSYHVAGVQEAPQAAASLPSPAVISECGSPVASAAMCEASEVDQTGPFPISNALRPRPGGDTCCVSCGGGQWCGCTVSTPCGSCTGSC